MKILIDIGHPAHVHYFRNFIYEMERKGHTYMITTRDKEVTLDLLNYYDLNYICMGKNLNGLWGKFWSIIRNDIKIFKVSLKFKPDLFLSFNIPFPAHVGFLLRKPVVGFTDTEHAKINHLLANPFTHSILTPSCYNKNLGIKHIRFNGYMELCYLHPNYFIPDPSILKLLGVKKDEKYIIMRFVSWNASHDVGHSGLSLDMKRKTLKELSKYAKVFVSSEGELPKDLKKYQIKIPPEKMHDVLYYATMYFGDGGTTASEAAILGTPSIHIATHAKYCGVQEELKHKYNLLYTFDNEDEGFMKAVSLMKANSTPKKYSKREKMLGEKIDVTAFMVWFIENYPGSIRIIKENPDYQYNFR